MESSCKCCGATLPESPAITGRDRLIGTPGSFDVKICPDCGSGTTFPIVSEGELGQFYPDEYSPHVDLPPASGALAKLKLRVRRYFTDRSMRQMPYAAVSGRRGELLDVGCGRGDLGALFIERGWDVSGIEPSPAACERAREKGIDVLTGTLGSVDLTGREFDVVNFRHSLEHVYDPTDDLQLVRGLLRPGGQVLVSVPNFGSLQRKVFKSRWFHLDLPRHRFHYTPDGLSRLFTRAGFEVDHVNTSISAGGLFGSLTYALRGRWVFRSGGWSGRATTYTSFALLPIAQLMAWIGGGEFLHLVATKPAEDAD